MSPVEWTRKNGDDVEGVVAILLAREFPNARRIRPSRGDGGRDVVVPNDRGHDVYQVKRFASNLATSEKTQIAKSYQRLLKAHQEGQISVTEGI